MRTAHFVCHAWDLADEGVELSLDRLAGEVGVDSVCVPAVTDAIDVYRPRGAGESRRFRTDGGIHYRADAQRFAATRIRPAPASWMKSRHVLADVAEHAAKRGLALRLAMSCCLNRAAAERHAFAVCKDAVGECRTARLCPSNPDVAAFVAAVAGDLAEQFAPAAIELENLGFGFDAAGSPEWIGMHVGPLERFLLSLCFCESCVQAAGRAGVDVTTVRERTVQALERVFGGEPARDESPDELLARDTLLADFTAFREQAVASIVASVRSAVQTELVVADPGEWAVGGFSPRGLRDACDAFRAPDGESIDAGAAPVESPYGVQPARVQRRFRCGPPQFHQASDLVRSVHRAVETGCEAIGFFDFGTTTHAGLDWARQALRFARRDAISS